MNSEEKTRFVVKEGGPLEVIGNFSIKGVDGKIIESGEIVYLCRCGASENKPFCDGAHRQIGFAN